MPKVRIYREANRRLHRVLGLYAALSAWTCDVDALVISRVSLMSALAVATLHEERVHEFFDDNESLFPYSCVVSGKPKVQGLVIARRALPKRDGWLGDSAERAAQVLNESGLPTAVLELPLESEAFNRLVPTLHGLEDPAIYFTADA